MKGTAEKKQLASPAADARECALALARILEDAKAEGVTVLDISELSAFTDFFVIATAASSVHMGGLYRAALDGAAAMGVRPMPVRQRNSTSEEWQLLDFGDIVVHLMTAPARAFYDLENLWFGAVKLWPEEE